ncbi:pitrilysin family protein [Nocardiopsis sp. NPDC006198]|uniref:M16 family metallopeptidase n=1 Tax=Nocardiopsis sp. NPDC006198 TaxID=3154472 RepID=UPI0033AFEBA2
MTLPPCLAADQAPQTTLTLAEPDAATGLVQRTVLTGGLRVITETLPGTSVAVGITADSGTRDEDTAHAGAAHFLEHLLFKGSTTRSRTELLGALDGVGARHNAFTTQESTTVRAHLRGGDLPVALDVLSDVVAHAALDPEAMEVERGVILQEIDLHTGNHLEHVGELFTSALFAGSGLGASIGGTPHSIRSISRQAVADCYRAAYVPSRLIVSAAGALEHDLVVDQVRTALSATMMATDGALPARPRPAHPRVRVSCGTTIESRDIDQAHLVLGVEGLAHTDERSYALQLVSAVLGEGPMSRLCARLREERGLVYAVFSSLNSFADTGELTFYAGCAPERADEVIALMRQELEEVAAKGIGAAELDRARARVLGGLALDHESVLDRRSGLVESELYHPRFVGLSERIERVQAVTPEEVAEVAAQVLTRPQTVAAVGPLDPDHVF